MGRSRFGLVRGGCAWWLAIGCAALAGMESGSLAQPSIPDEPGLVVLPPAFPQSVVVVREHTPTSVRELIDSRAGYKVVEPSVNGRASGDLSPADVAAMKHTEERACFSVVVAYLSIGQAEDHRGYWRAEWVNAAGAPIPGIAPGWLGPGDAQRRGRYQVRYWHRAWKDLLLGVPAGPEKSALDRILEQGFDGLYLDMIDASEFWGTRSGEIGRRLARERMVRLVEQIEEYATARRGAEFRVYVQNGESIVLDDAGHSDDLTLRYGGVVDGVGFEDLFYDGTRRVPESETLARLDKLGPLYANRAWCAAIGCGPQFFAIDYVLRGENLNTLSNRRRATRLHELAMGRGLIPYAAGLDRRLDEVVELGGPRWTIAQPEDRCGLMCPVCLAGLDLVGALAVAGPAQAAPAPDGVVDQRDADYFFAAYGRGSMHADLTGCAAPGQAGYGVPDGVVDQSDVAYFVEWYVKR